MVKSTQVKHGVFPVENLTGHDKEYESILRVIFCH